MRTTPTLALIAALAACGRGGSGTSTGDKPAPTPPPPATADAPVRNDFFGERTAIERACTDAIAAYAAARDGLHRTDPAAPPGPDAVARVTCADLYVGSCRRAWTDLPARAADDGIATVIDRCAAVYCDDLPAPKPAACRDHTGRTDLATLAELDRAMLVHDGTADALAATIVGRDQWFATIAAGIQIETPPDPSWQPPPVVAIAMTATSTTIDGTAVTADELAARIAAATRADAATKFVLQVDKDLPYARVVAIIDTIKANGGTSIALATK